MLISSENPAPEAAFFFFLLRLEAVVFFCWSGRVTLSSFGDLAAASAASASCSF